MTRAHRPIESHLPPAGRLPHSDSPRLGGFALGVIVGAVLLLVVVLIAGRITSVVVVPPSGHMPQSTSQLEQVSPVSHTPLPQYGGMQSAGSVGLPMQISQ